MAVGLAALLALFLPGAFASAVQSLADGFLRRFDGWTLLMSTLPLVFCLAVLLLPHGRRVIGGPAAKPEFGAVTWTAMMFAAGMGAGLVFWGAAEPLIHAANPPPGEGLLGGTAGARSRALAITQFHWALHAWAIYGVAAISIGMALSGQGPLLPSRPFPFLPPAWRRTIDMIALLAVLFGLVASLGQGVFQVGAGVETITGGTFGGGAGGQALLLLVLMSGYLASAALGLRRGIAVLSNVNVVLAFLLAGFIFLAGPTGAILATLGESAAAYIGSIPELSTSLRPEGPSREWTRDWSLTYFLWWIAWTPFTGVFLARISRGRSLRAFVVAAVLVPSLVTLVWFSVLGGAALHLQAEGADLGISSFASAPLATYRLLESLPFTGLFQLVTMLLVTVFLITSADSGAYVLAMFSEEDSEPAVGPRMFWGLILAALTGAAILSAEGQNITRAMAVAGAIPLTLLLAGQGLVAGWRIFGEPVVDVGRKKNPPGDTRTEG